MAALEQILGNAVFGCFLDWRKFSLNARGRYAYVSLPCSLSAQPSSRTISQIAMMALTGGTWIYAAVVQSDYSARAVKPSFDWADEGWARAWFLYILVQLSFSLIYNHAYWSGALSQASRRLAKAERSLTTPALSSTQWAAWPSTPARLCASPQSCEE